MVKRRGQHVWVGDIARAARVSRQAVYLHFGSRANLLVATVRYVDEVLGLDERLRQVKAADSGAEILQALVEFWGNYLPEIYGLAKALLAVYDTDKDAATAWDDRMGVLQEGCRNTIECLERDGTLVPGWELEDAASLVWAVLAVAVWENLTIKSGWSTDQYIHRMQRALKHTFVNTG
jgi:AcrR family transcriptional regulator